MEERQLVYVFFIKGNPEEVTTADIDCLTFALNCAALILSFECAVRLTHHH